MFNHRPFEEEFRKFLQQRHARFIDQTRSYHDADFALMLSDGARFALEVKEKRQAYVKSVWPANTPEPHMFILDELTVRKCLGFAPRAGVAIKDVIGERYVFFSVIDLALMPRVRVNRRIERNQPDLKGKWIVDLRNGRQATRLMSCLAISRLTLPTCIAFSTKFILATATTSARPSPTAVSRDGRNTGRRTCAAAAETHDALCETALLRHQRLISGSCNTVKKAIEQRRTRQPMPIQRLNLS